MRPHVGSGSLLASPECGVAEREFNGQCSRMACLWVLAGARCFSWRTSSASYAIRWALTVQVALSPLQYIFLCTIRLLLDWITESGFELQETQWISFSYILQFCSHQWDRQWYKSFCNEVFMLNHCVNFSFNLFWITGTSYSGSLEHKGSLFSIWDFLFLNPVTDAVIEFIRS